MKFHIDRLAQDVSERMFLIGSEMDTENIDEDKLIEQALEYVMEGIIEDKYKDSLLIMMNHNQRIRDTFDELYQAERSESEWEGGLTISSKMRSVGLKQTDFLM